MAESFRPPTRTRTQTPNQPPASRGVAVRKFYCLAGRTGMGGGRVGELAASLHLISDIRNISWGLRAGDINSNKKNIEVLAAY